MVPRGEARYALDALVRQRIQGNAAQIRNSLHQIAIGNPWGSEPETERAVERRQRKTGLSRPSAESVAAGIRAVAAEAPNVAEGVGGAGADGREAIWGQTLDFVDVSFLDRGRAAANAVARVAFRDGRAQGSGLLVAPGLFLTNHHVIDSAGKADQLCAEFRYEKGARLTSFAFDPASCFVTDSVDGLDFTLIQVGRRLEGEEAIGRFGYVPLSDAPDKHMLGEVANIVQHPQGRYKELVLRENQLVGRDELSRVLHYIADTEPGSSGSPVFNNQWEVIALHHWGGPWLEGQSLTGKSREINEGIRVSEIVKFLRLSMRNLDGKTADAVQDSLRRWGGESPPQPRPAPDFFRRSEAAEAGGDNEDFSDRGGFETGFLPGFVVPLPKLGGSHTPARNLKALADDDRHELRYHHFSIVMNAKRRLAYFTACNIDGARVARVDRKTKTVDFTPTIDEMDLESLEAAEASDPFRRDPRIDPDEQMWTPFYQDQIVPGFPVKTSGARKARMFQKGHIIMRGDPVWGMADEAAAAERDTFFYTNAAPQVGYFNQGSPFKQPGTKGKLRWRAVETYVLRNAFTMRQRVSVFAGPIFDDADPEYRFGSQVPLRFWKIASWVEDGALRAIALVANQSEVLTVMPEGIGGAEAFLDDDEIARVSQFLTTVEYLQDQTGLDFGDALRDADVRAGENVSANVVEGVDASVLRPRTKAKAKAARAKPAGAKSKRLPAKKT